MTTTVTIEANSVSGATMNELGNQIQRRVQVLKETTSQAVTATAIQTIKSLRAMTPRSSGNIIPLQEEITNNDLGIAIQPAPEYYVGFKTVGKIRKPCIRLGKNGAVVDLKPWYRIALTDMYNANVFRVILSDGRKQAWKRSKSPYYIVARDISSAKLAVEQRYNKIVKRYSSLGKDAWSRAMMLVSDRPAKFVASEKAKTVLQKEVFVMKSGQGFGYGNYFIKVNDNLRYSGTVIGGDVAVNSAMMKACNSTNGYLNNWIQNHPNSDFFGTELPDAPFPPECFGE